MGKIKFKPLFLIYVFCCVYFGWYNQVFYYVVSVVLHEYGHFFVAKKMGYQSQGIVFNLYGAGLNSSAVYKRRDDVIISFAGPFVNCVLILLLICFWWIFPSSYNYTYELFKSNLAIMIFNLIPIYPLDGGRVLVAILGDKFKKDKIFKINKLICFTLGVFLLGLFILSIFQFINFSFLFIGSFLILNSFGGKSSLYFEKTLSLSKCEKEMEVRLFKVSSFDNINLLKYLRPEFYSVFICKQNGKICIRCEDDIFNP